MDYSSVFKKLQKIDQKIEKIEQKYKILTNLSKNQFSSKKFRKLSETQLTQKSCENFHNLRPTKKYRIPIISLVDRL